MKWALKWLSVFVVSCIVCVVIGMMLDAKLHTSPIFVLMFVAYAIIGNFYLLWKDVKKNG